MILRVLDPSESDFDFRQPAMFRDMESGRNLYVDPATARDAYRKRFNEHAQSVRRMCNDLGIDLYPMTTERPLELVLYDFLNSRLRRGRRIARRGSARLRGVT